MPCNLSALRRTFIVLALSAAAQPALAQDSGKRAPGEQHRAYGTAEQSDTASAQAQRRAPVRTKMLTPVETTERQKQLILTQEHARISKGLAGCK